MHVDTFTFARLVVDLLERCSEEEEEEEVGACSDGEPGCFPDFLSWLHSASKIQTSLLLTSTITHTRIHTHMYSAPGYCRTSHVQAGECRHPGAGSQLVCPDLGDCGCEEKEDGTTLEVTPGCAAAQEGACQRRGSLSW